MSVTAHVTELQKKHEQLSQLVEKEQKSPGTNDFTITQMKKEKLKLKEEIQRLKTKSLKILSVLFCHFVCSPQASWQPKGTA